MIAPEHLERVERLSRLLEQIPSDPCPVRIGPGNAAAYQDSLQTLLAYVRECQEALEPFGAVADGGMKMVADLPDKTKVEVVGKVPRRNEWFEIASYRPEGVTLGDFRRAARLSRAGGGGESGSVAPATSPSVASPSVEPSLRPGKRP